MTRTAPLARNSSPTAAELWASADIVFKVRAPSSEEVGLLREGGCWSASSGRRRTPT